MALTCRIGLILGGAGVGKTTVLAAVHRAAERGGIHVTQMALSGRAAMRMREATSRPARTIAGFLHACAKGELQPDQGTLVVVDEASMLDLPLLYSILRHLGDGCRLLLVGDPSQLPPIGFGLTFHLFAGNPAIPQVELTQVHRQAAETGIPASPKRSGRVIARYHNRAVDAVQVLQELINMAKALREQPDDGLTPEEVAFYDALPEDKSALELMENSQLRVIASELVKTVRENSTVDWWKSYQRRANIRLKVKRVLRRFGYPSP